ncbi:hypothetical protein BOX15_Mlig028349g1, partial [Macrostomum lignano]
ADQSRPLWLLAHSSMAQLAKEIADHSAATAAGQKSRLIVYKDSVSWDRFADGFPNIFIHNVQQMAGQDVVFLASLHEPSVIFEQVSLIHSLPRYFVRSLTLLLPYFPCGTMERVDREGQVATAMSVARLLNSTPLTRHGPCQLVVYDIHALQERFYFTDCVVPLLASAMSLLYPQLYDLRRAQPGLAIAFPDEGAFKRFHLSFSVPEHADDLITCLKVRDGDSRVIRVKEGSPAGRHVVIVDDLVQTGGTLIQCAAALKSLGASAVSAFVPHAVFPRESWRRFTDGQGLFEHFWITDSLPHARQIAQHPPFRLLSLAEPMVNLLTNSDALGCCDR